MEKENTEARLSPQVGKELDLILGRAVRLSNMAKTSLQRSVWALKERSVEGARQVMAEEESIDALTDQINQDCLNFIARYQPLGQDLRCVTSLMLMIRDLERIGDYGKNIAKEALALLQLEPLKPLIDIPRMSDLVGQMMELCAEALSGGDPERAEGAVMKVFAMDDQVDDLEEQILRELLFLMMEQPGKIGQAHRLLNVARILERAGDHGTNLAEHIYFIFRGRRIHASALRRQEAPDGFESQDQRHGAPENPGH